MDIQKCMQKGTPTIRDLFSNFRDEIELYSHSRVANTSSVLLAVLALLCLCLCLLFVCLSKRALFLLFFLLLSFSSFFCSFFTVLFLQFFFIPFLFYLEQIFLSSILLSYIVCEDEVSF